MIKCWYCNEEITTGNNPEHLGICDKCYNEMFECGNEFIRNMVNKVADLEEKLALTEKALEIACNEQDLYWFSKYAYRDGVDLVEWLKNYAKEMMKGE